ncbi:NYN domain-containing protein [Stenotrophomonas sp. PS02300]|uniref:NYN domain-containing protein n=1 Tax=Stenotrophomonas sp. PS02300 TaxID=2991426 RepID=UPI00249C3D5D|nr:NYN domain-containing protein [Stenotrophomonas sp. PS02300]
MASLIYVDDSNLRATARELLGSAHWQLWGAVCNYKALQEMLSFGEQPKAARIYGSFGSAAERHALIVETSKAGFVPSFVRRLQDKEKGVDTALVADLIADSFISYEPGDEVIIVSGDADYLPAIIRLKERGISVSVAFWDRGLADSIQRSGCNLVSLQSHLKNLVRLQRPKKKDPKA